MQVKYSVCSIVQYTIVRVKLSSIFTLCPKPTFTNKDVKYSIISLNNYNNPYIFRKMIINLNRYLIYFF